MSGVCTSPQAATNKEDRQMATEEQSSSVLRAIHELFQNSTPSPIIKTGLVSPQYHMQFDDFFETTKLKEYLPKSMWQVKARPVKPQPSNTPNLDTKCINKDIASPTKGKQYIIRWLELIGN